MAERRLDPVTLSVLASALAGIAEEMGAVLIRGAYSSNIKERRDCSAALFDAEGRMVAQAEHIPVHLGAMPESVAAVIERRPARRARCGSSTTPTAAARTCPTSRSSRRWRSRASVLGYAVTRAHHSDVGGMRPGSMPSDSREIWQEGLVIPPVRLVRDGEYDDELLELLLANVRTPDDPPRRPARADRREPAGRARACASWSSGVAATSSAPRSPRCSTTPSGARARRSPSCPTAATRRADEIEGDGVTDEDIPIAVAVEIDGDALTIDFAGTADAGRRQRELPARRHALGLLLRAAGPAARRRAGERGHLRACSRSTRRRARSSTPTSPAAVVAGNVETSQRIADTVLDALAQAVDLPGRRARGR